MNNNYNFEDDNSYFDEEEQKKKKRKKRLLIISIFVLLILAALSYSYTTGIIEFNSNKKDKKKENETTLKEKENKKTNTSIEEKKDETVLSEQEEKKEEIKNNDTEEKTTNNTNNTPTINYLDGKKAFSINCYTYESVSKNEHYVLANYAMKGDKIVCFVGYEVNANDPVKSYNYTLSYSGLKLIKEEVGNATKKGNTYSFNLSEPSSVGLIDEKYTFEVTNSDNMYFGINDVKYVTTSEKNYKANNANFSLTYVWNASNDSFNHYTLPYDHQAFSINCYTYDSYKINKPKIATNIKVGDKIACEIGYETKSTDTVKTFKWTVDTGDGLKFTSVERNSTDEDYVQKDNSYTYFLTNPTPMGDNLGMYIFEVVNTKSINILLNNIKFVTSDNKFYYNDNITKTFQ